MMKSILAIATILTLGAGSALANGEHVTAASAHVDSRGINQTHDRVLPLARGDRAGATTAIGSRATKPSVSSPKSQREPESVSRGTEP